MIYFWSSEYNSGIFFFWKGEKEDDVLKSMRKHHAKPFDFGQTSEGSWRGGRKAGDKK
jgi:hypothetical protein